MSHLIISLPEVDVEAPAVSQGFGGDAMAIDYPAIALLRVVGGPRPREGRKPTAIVLSMVQTVTLSPCASTPDRSESLVVGRTQFSQLRMKLLAGRSKSIAKDNFFRCDKKRFAVVRWNGVREESGVQSR